MANHVTKIYCIIIESLMRSPNRLTRSDPIYKAVKDARANLSGTRVAINIARRTSIIKGLVELVLK